MLRIMSILEATSSGSWGRGGGRFWCDILGEREGERDEQRKTVFFFAFFNGLINFRKLLEIQIFVF